MASFRSIVRHMLACWVAALLPVSVSAASYYVAANGSNTAAGTTEAAPLQTIAAAVGKAMSGDAVLLRRGDVFRESVAFTQSNITVDAYGSGANPVISGGVLITGWTKANLSGKPSVWSATLNTAVEHLYANGEPVWLARYPNDNATPSPYVICDNYAQGGSGYTITSRLVTDCPRDASGYWNGATIRWRRWTWWWETRKVTSYTTNGTTGTIQVDGGGSYWNMATQRVGFYFENKLSELDTVNEWYYDAAAKKIYLWAPASADPNGMLIEGSSLGTGLKVNGSKVANITVRCFKGPGMSINGTTTVDRCRIECIGGDGGAEGIRGEAGTLNAKITNCFFRYCHNIGIHINETTTGGSTLIEYDTMQSIGNRPGWGARMGTWHAKKLNTHYCGVAISYGKNVKVRHCVFDSTGYAAINPLDDQETIEYNVIRHAMARLNDGGGIYAPTTSTTFRQNIILDVIGETVSERFQGNIAHGLWIEYIHDYHDNQVIGNTVAYSPQQGLWLPRNQRTLVTGNVLYGNKDAQMRVDAFEGSGATAQNNRIEKNVFFATAATQKTFSYQWDCNFGTVSGNWYCNPYAQYVINAPARPMTPQEWYAAYPAVGDATAKTDLIKRPASTPAANPIGTSKLLINETGTRTRIAVGDNGVYKDLSGATVVGGVDLDPYTSIVIVHTGTVSTVQADAGRTAAAALRVVGDGRGLPVISYHLPQHAQVTARLYDMRGTLVSTMVSSYQQSGPHAIRLGRDGPRPAAGTYQCVLEVGTGSAKVVRKAPVRLTKQAGDGGNVVDLR